MRQFAVAPWYINQGKCRKDLQGTNYHEARTIGRKCHIPDNMPTRLTRYLLARDKDFNEKDGGSNALVQFLLLPQLPHTTSSFTMVKPVEPEFQQVLGIFFWFLYGLLIVR